MVECSAFFPTGNLLYNPSETNNQEQLFLYEYVSGLTVDRNCL